MLKGTLIESTMRPQDLIPAFSEHLGRYPEEMPKEALGDEDHKYWQSEECSFDLEELFDALNDLADPGYYFGAHPGNGSDYGYWEDEDF